MRRLTADAARRAALAAQGLARPANDGGVRNVTHYRKVMATVATLQLDSVNVVSRSHYLPVFARLGVYETEKLDRYTAASGEIFEYWGHMASLLPVADHRLFRWRMEEWPPWRSIRRFKDEDPGYFDEVYRIVAEEGPLRTGELEGRGERTGPWWGYARGKHVLEWLFATGKITAYRDRNFHRIYDLPERVIDRRHLEVEPATWEEAHAELLLRGARAHGVGTAKDIADYYRLKVPRSRPIFEDLVKRGKLLEVEVDGWKGPVYMHPDAVVPRVVEGSALLSPFDSLVWERARTERVFGFHYRIEIYVPEPKRIHGYYVLPYLLDGELVARVDLKAHRKESILEARSAFVEDGRDKERVARRLAADLGKMAEWLGLGEVTVVRRGNLAAGLARRV